MTLLLRAIVREADAERLRDDTFVVVRAAGLAAVATAMDASATPTEPALREHEMVTRRIHDSVASLPARFGQVFATADALAEALRSRADELNASVERVGARVEVAITLRWRDVDDADDAHEPPEASNGRQYLASRAIAEHERRRSEEIVERLVAELACERASARHKTCPRRGVAAIVAILIERDEIDSTRERVVSFGERSGEVSAVIDGIFAPYSFAA